MSTFIARRLLLAVPTIFIVSLIVFSLIRMIPGDVVTLMYEENAYAPSVQELREKLGLTKPLYVQYMNWVGDMARGNFGESLWTKRSISQELTMRFPVTLQLMGMAMLFAVTFGLAGGILTAIRQDAAVDYIVRILAIVALAMPGFWIGTLVMVFGSIWLNWSPPVDFVPFVRDPSKNLGMFIVPALILSFERGAQILRMTRAMMLEVLRQDYVRTAWAKGLREKMVIYRHVMRNAAIPVLTLMGLQIPFILGGSIIMETIFSLPGVGPFMYSTITKRDYPMLQSITLLFATVTILVNLVIDVAYGFFDPRVRYR